MLSITEFSLTGTAVCAQASPYLMLPSEMEAGSKNKRRYEGYCADLAEKIAKVVGFEFEMIPVKDGKYGATDENGAWNGMVGELIRKVN